ncbi:VWA domain-containing protein [Aureliella helgolandensis]|uniref:von Willebrand factor type A domain protein n=1 Tax=Aureliella helgolandensis TaxID=2527968 RepID=A0A518G8T8_9BACT|nr:vWA domain-containing protein [Aureliella helgolandensis]QDV25015.1 von Willebrand factor type A domain protein [Aureliella helgolandensis]
MRCPPHNRRGAMLILVAAVLVILLVGAVFSIDVAYMHMVRAELRTATDAAARAGSEVLSRTQDTDLARATAANIALQNIVAGEGLVLEADDIEIGGVQRNANGRLDFLSNQAPFNAVRVNGRREDSSVNGSVRLFFARLFTPEPFQPVQSATAAASVMDVALVLDVSGSMSTRSGGVTRIQALKDSVNVFLDEIERSSPHVIVSLSTYSTTAQKLIPLTSNFASIRARVATFNANGLTAIGNGLLTGSNSLTQDANRRDFAAKVIIIMTDGQQNTGPSPATTVNTAVARGQTVHTITFSSGANQNLMRQVAQATVGGIHIHADDAADLAAAFEEIARTLSVTLID